MKYIAVFIIIGTLVALATWMPSTEAAEPEQTHLLRSKRQPGAIDHITALLEIGGQRLEKENVGAKPRSIPVSVVCNLDYAEKTLEVPAETGGRWRSVRCYDQAAAVLKIGDDGAKPSLRSQRSLIGAQMDREAATLFSPHGPLTRDELELIDVVGSSLVLDRLLPENRVRPGDTWKHDDKVLAMLLKLDAVRQSGVQSALKEVTDTVARFEMSGRVEGTVNDVASSVDLKAKYRLDLRTGRIDWFGLVLNERREISEVEAGIDVTARLQLRITPKDSSPALDDAALKDLPLEATAETNPLQYESADLGWRLTHDRGWHLIDSHRDLAVFKLVDRGDIAAQCNISALSQRSPEELPSLEDFQQEIRQALAKSFGEFVESGQSSDEADRRVYRVIVRGEVSQVPIQWNYYLVADQHGRQVTFAFTVKGELAERLHQADEKLVQAIGFMEPETAAAEKK